MCGFSQSELMNRMDETMLVNEYAQKVISERQYKYQTRQSYLNRTINAARHKRAVHPALIASEWH